MFTFGNVDANIAIHITRLNSCNTIVDFRPVNMNIDTYLDHLIVDSYKSISHNFGPSGFPLISIIQFAMSQAPQRRLLSLNVMLPICLSCIPLLMSKPHLTNWPMTCAGTTPVVFIIIISSNKSVLLFYWTRVSVKCDALTSSWTSHNGKEWRIGGDCTWSISHHSTDRKSVV